MDACIGHDRAGRNRIHILLHDPLDQHAGCHRIYRPGAARPAAGILKDENADQPPSATNWIFGTTREVRNLHRLMQGKAPELVIT